jgi:hypothetical protein
MIILYLAWLIPSCLAIAINGKANVVIQDIAKDLGFVTDLAFLDASNILVSLKNGPILLVKNGKVRAEPVLDMSPWVTGASGDRGVESIAIDPKCAFCLHEANVTKTRHDPISMLLMFGILLRCKFTRRRESTIAYLDLPCETVMLFQARKSCCLDRVKERTSGMGMIVHLKLELHTC